MLCALIMAGGKGTRFWPLSTEKKPKQFLNLLGEETMIQMTVNRISPLIPMERIFVCTGERYVQLVKDQLPELSEDNIIVEPEGRNTAPCVALSAFIIKRKYKDATMVVLPSDHLIRDEERFLRILNDSDELLNDYCGAVVTLGITPSRAETGYGYIESSNKKIIVNNREVLKVSKFVEKPNKYNAEEYLKNGNYLWNSGMFLWKVEYILNQIEKYLPNTYSLLKNIENIDEEKLKMEITLNYRNTDKISIDYGIMEKCEDIYVIPSDIGWDDVGSWSSLERYREKDKNNNVCVGDVDTIHSKNNIIVANKKPVILCGLNDIFMIESDEFILMGKRQEINDVKLLKTILDEKYI